MPFATYKPDLALAGLPDARRVLVPVGPYATLEPVFQLPNLRHLILPEGSDFTARNGRDYGSQSPYLWTNSLLTRSAADGAWNGRDVFSFAAVGANLRMTPRQGVPRSFSVVFPLSISAAALAQAMTFLMTFRNRTTEALEASLWWESAGTFKFRPAGTTTNDAQIALSNLPAADVKTIIQVDYDADAVTTRFWVGDPVSSKGSRTNHTSSPTGGAAFDITIGTNLNSGASAFSGKMGMVLMTDGVMTADQRSSVFAALKAYYAIA